jgi:hypothetical protein
MAGNANQQSKRDAGPDVREMSSLSVGSSTTSYAGVQLSTRVIRIASVRGRKVTRRKCRPHEELPTGKQLFVAISRSLGMNFHVDSETAYAFAVISVVWSVLVTVIWLVIGHRAMRAHERIAKAFEQWVSGR